MKILLTNKRPQIDKNLIISNSPCIKGNVAQAGAKEIHSGLIFPHRQFLIFYASGAMMKSAAALALLLLLPVHLLAAAMQEPALKAGATIKNKYFSLTIPKGWMMPAPLREQPNGGVSAVFSPESGDPAVTLNVLPFAVDIPDYIEKMTQDMKKNGLSASRPEKRNGFYRITISGKANGEGWFGGRSQLFGAVMIFGADIRSASRLLAALKPAEKGIFPEKIN